MAFVPAWQPRADARCSAGAGPRDASASFPDALARRGDRIGPFNFTARQRLRHKAQFDHVYRSGLRCTQAFFQAAACANSQGFARLGLAIAVRTAGSGVARNRLRRLVREVFRLHQHELPAVDVVVSARPKARGASPPELRTDLELLFAGVAARTAASSVNDELRA
jgi:ribonuclease P protein component